MVALLGDTEARTPESAPPSSSALLEWFDGRRARYPWRRTSDPYAVWVSEVMLQQTQAGRVVPHFERFLASFPTVETLAAASFGDVIRAWDGLGYNRRALALADAARVVVARHGAAMPDDVETLRRLPGIGPYTAAAIASIAFGRCVAAIDTNVRRVVARVRAGVEPDEMAPRDIERLAERWIDVGDPGAWNQAVMDVGREHCRPRPRCDGCPLVAGCRFHAWRPDGAASRRRSATAGRSSERFEGSRRQLRGAIVRELRRAGASTVANLTAASGFGRDDVVETVSTLAKERLVVASAAALRGSARGVVRLPS